MIGKFVIIADLRGGMNSAESPLSLPNNQCVAAVNVDWRDTLIGRKRYGTTSVDLTGGTAFVGPFHTLLRFVPGTDEAAAELFAFDAASPTLVKRLAGGVSWADVTLSDAITTTPVEIYGAVLNGRLFIAYDSAVDRLHAYDPGLSSPRIRRVGLAASGAPTVANTGAGAYPATLRYYKQETLQLDGTTVRRSELSASVSFTPSGGGTAARVTQGTLPGEQETHWRVFASADDTTYYLISGNIAIGTTTYDDSATVSTYSQGTPQEPTGTFSNWTSVKYLLSDGNRLLGAGAWETGNKTSRVYFSPVLGSLDQGDAERIPNTVTSKNFIDLNEKDGGGITGMGLLGNTPIVFKFRQFYQLVPTGDATAPYLSKRISNTVGCVSGKSIASGEDEHGRHALYWLSHRGPYRYGADGLQYLGRDIEDAWVGPTTRMNLSATNVVAHSVYYGEQHQWWLWLSLGSGNDPSVKYVFDSRLGRPNDRHEVRGGWAKHDGDSAAARSSVMFARSIAASMSRDLKPYIGRATGTDIQMCDDTLSFKDGMNSSTFAGGTSYQAFITTKPLTDNSVLGRNLGLGQTSIVGLGSATAVGPPVVNAPTITQTITRDFGLETVTSTVDLTPAASETRVIRKLEGSQMSTAGVIQLTLGDASASSSRWFIDAIVAPIDVQEPR